MAGVRIENVEKSFGSVKVIRNVDIEAEDGEFVVLVHNLNPKDRDIAMVFQNYALYPHMTVRENMEFSLVLRQVQKSERDARVDRAASILGIKELLARRPGQLSGGQRQRVAMGRAIVRDPQVFLFDEPLSNLDAKLRVQMRGEIRELHRRLGTTCIYVTHDQIEAMTMADRIVVMHDGVEQVGAPLDLYDRPGNLFVGVVPRFAGHEFLLAADRRGRPFVSEDGSFVVSPRKAPHRPGARVICGFRPEAVVLDSNSPVKMRVA